MRPEVDFPASVCFSLYYAVSLSADRFLQVHTHWENSQYALLPVAERPQRSLSHLTSDLNSDPPSEPRAHTPAHRGKGVET